MISQILSCLGFLAVAAVCVGWAAVWIKTFRGESAGALVLHTVVFSVLSAVIMAVVRSIVFSEADESYSASNLGALGFLYMMFLVPFVCACLIAFFQTVGDLITRREKPDDDPDENNEEQQK